MKIENKDYKKLYEEALEKAKFLKENTDGVGAKDVSKCFEAIFPELAESEDEKIRKWIVDYLKCRLPDAGEFADEYNTALNWLEKQGEQKSTEQKPNFCHHEVDFSNCSEEYRKAYYDGWNNCNQQHEQMKNLQKSAWSEEDEKMVDNIRDTINDSIQYCDVDDIGTKARFALEKEITWLKSLKERVQLQSQWKPTKEQLNSLLNVAADTIGFNARILSELYDDLKKL